MNLVNFTLGELSGYVHYLLYYQSDKVLATGFLARSKTGVTAMRQNLGLSPIRIGKKAYSTYTKDQPGWPAYLKYYDCGRDHFTYCLAFSPLIGEDLMLTSRECVHDDLYNHLMTQYKLPLLREWMPKLLDRLEQQNLIHAEYVLSATGNIEVPFHHKMVPHTDLMCYTMATLTEEDLEQVVSSMLKKQEIKFTDKPQIPLDFKGLDGYFQKYGQIAIKNLHEKLNPLTELKTNVRNLALKNKSLFPQQAATVEGIVAMEEAGYKYAVLNHGMGCGKTLESASACEAIAVGKWLKAHPDKTLRDAYEKDGLINYRTIIMAPGHLVEKWAQEVKEEIPYAKTTVIRKLSQLCELREQGRKPANGKEFFIISKDKAKLGTQLSPIPVKMGYKPLSLGICMDCAEEDQKVVYKAGAGTDSACPTCKGKRIRPVPQPGYGSFKGMICPHCGELLLKYTNISPSSTTFQQSPESYVLTPASFAKPNKSNSACYHCGGALWGANARPVIMGKAKEKVPKWRKISYFTNQTMKTRESAFVLNGFENDYWKDKVKKGLTYAPSIYGPRTIAPSWYIKKYLKGYFDFCILDEAHKYLGESAQSVSAHSLVKVSRFTMALTGTISNGTATCFFNLFFMLEPKRLINMGYRYSSLDRQLFCRKFGCVETEYSIDENATRNSMSRGKALGAPKVKPGISPVLFGALLMDCCLFMDISDLSRYLPPLIESVRTVPLPKPVMAEYQRVIDNLGQIAKHDGLGMSILAQQLQFGLTYPDKPYGRGPIKHPYAEESILCRVENFKSYEEGELLPKEEILAELVNQEMSEGRNCFVYATATNGAEACITNRLKWIIEHNCNLSGRVEIIQSSSPAASEREAWFHKRAADGIKVFICNPRNVETGLDFCFKHDGVAYNFPTLIFYQISYELATVWQASRRAYRLSQKEECRNYYLAYSNTLQAAALQIMAKKQVATAAIQGHFSAEGLASMAQGVDARTLLAKALSDNDLGASDDLSSMFDVLSSSNQAADDDGFSGFLPSKTFYELTGKKTAKEYADDSLETLFAELPVVSYTEIAGSTVSEAKAEEEEDAYLELKSLFGLSDPTPQTSKSAGSEKQNTDATDDLAAFLGLSDEPAARPKKKVTQMEGQLDFASYMAAI